MPDPAGPDRRVLVAVDMESYSRRDNLLQYRAQQDFQALMHDAVREVGLDRTRWVTQQLGDGELAILPQDTSEVTVVSRFAPTVDRLLRTRNAGLAPEARIRLRISIHQGLVHLDGMNGFPGAAVVAVCRLLDAPPVKAALTRFPAANVALIVSDHIYQDVVRHYRELRPERFQRVAAVLPDKNFEATAWIFVPDEDATVADPRPTEPALASVTEHLADIPTRTVTTEPAKPVAAEANVQFAGSITAHGPASFGNNNTMNISAADEQPSHLEQR